MLKFTGSMFNQTPAMHDQYQEFLAYKDTEDAFLKIDCVDHIDFGAFKAQPAARIGSAKLKHAENHSGYLISFTNFDLVVSKDFRELTLRTASVQNLDESALIRLNEGVHQVAKFRALFCDMLVLHASAIVYRDEVLLFSGMSGAGKSTQANLWLKNTDSWVLNYDKPIVKITEDGVLASGSPWGGKEDLSINEMRPARALFFVHQAKENRLVRLSSAMAYSRMYLNYFVYPLTKEIEDRYSESLVRIIKRIPVYDLYCTDTKEAVECVHRELYPSEV